MIFTTFKHIAQQNSVIIRNFSSDVRVRFAPSPTGDLHLGGLRTALYNFLFAKSHKGRFILRIEDTDRNRLVEGSTESLQRDLEWVGIDVDEGPTSQTQYGPYIQSERLTIYSEHVKALLDNGHAYHCFCTDKRLDLLRRQALKNREVPKYDNRCRNLTNEEVRKRLANKTQSCIRFKLSSGLETFHDLIYGPITYDVSLNEGDPVIVKNDGFPTYHFANVVDDHCMKISHVLRGTEWQISTTKHILLYKAFGWKPPIYGHLPLLLNADGTKLSKRQGDIKIRYYRENGIFPIALINFITNSGGGFRKDSEYNVKPKCYTIEELSEQFNVSRINSHSGKLMSDRLLEFNRLELKRQLENGHNENMLVNEVRQLVKSSIFDGGNLDLDENHVKNILHWSCNRITKLSDLISNDLKFIWTMPEDYNVDKVCLEKIKLIVDDIEKMDHFSRDEISSYLKIFCENNGVRYGGFMRALRSVLSGLKEGPGVSEMLEILGKENTVKRLRLCLKNANM